MRNRFTAETAKAAGRRSAELRAIRKANAQERRVAIAELALESVANDDQTFPRELKARVRVQTLETLTRLEEENANGTKVDGAKLDRLASALERLAELERVLDGRPAPGTRRPPREDAPPHGSTPRPPAIPTPASATPSPAASIPAPSPGEAPQAQTSGRLLSEPPEF